MTKQNEPAFPHEGATLAVRSEIENTPELRDKVIAIASQHYGLTKREYFAGLAMQGWCGNQHREGTSVQYAIAAVAAADALIAELNKQEEPKR